MRWHLPSLVASLHSSGHHTWSLVMVAESTDESHPRPTNHRATFAWRRIARRSNEAPPLTAQGYPGLHRTEDPQPPSSRPMLGGRHLFRKRYRPGRSSRPLSYTSPTPSPRIGQSSLPQDSSKSLQQPHSTTTQETAALPKPLPFHTPFFRSRQTHSDTVSICRSYSSQYTYTLTYSTKKIVRSL